MIPYFHLDLDIFIHLHPSSHVSSLLSPSLSKHNYCHKGKKRYKVQISRKVPSSHSDSRSRFPEYPIQLVVV